MYKKFLKLDSFINQFGLFIFIIYKIILELIYIKIIVPIFYYSGFTFSFNMYKYLILWIIALLFYPAIKSNFNKKNPSNSILTILYFAGMIPGIVLLSFMNVDYFIISLYFCYWISITILNIFIPKIEIKKPSYKLCKVYTYLIVSYFIAIILFISLKYTGLRMNFNLFNVYELRTEALNFQLPSILDYSFASAKVFLPIAFIYFLSDRKNLIAFFIFFIQFLAFSIDGSKSTIFSIILIYLCYKFYHGLPNKIFYFGLVLFSFLGWIECLLFKSYYLVNFLIRRLMFIPNLLHIYYFDYFSRNDKDYFRQGVMGRFGMKSPYEVSIPNIIGKKYMGSESIIANNGLFSDAYYNLGILGIIILPLFIIVALRILDTCSKGIKYSILISVITTSAYTLISSSFFTVMLTHGFLIVCLSLLFLPRKNYISNIGEKNVE